MKLQNIRYLNTHQIDPAAMGAYNRNGHYTNKTVTHQQTYGFSNDYIVIGEPYGRNGDGVTPYIELRDMDNTLLWYDVGLGGSLFGHSVAIYGDKIVVGAPNWTAQGGNNPGAVFVYRLDGLKLVEIYNPGAVLNYNDFGMHVAVNSTGFATTSLGFVFLYDWSGNEIANNEIANISFFGITTEETAYETGLASNNIWNVTDSRRCNVRMNETIIAVTYQYPYTYPLNRNDYSGVNNNIYGDTTNFRTIQSRLFIFDMNLNLVQDCTIPSTAVSGGKYLGGGIAVTANRIYASAQHDPSGDMQIYVFDLSGTVINRFKLPDSTYHSVMPTLAANEKYLCVGNTAGREISLLSPGATNINNTPLSPDRTYDTSAQLNFGVVDIYDTEGIFLGTFMDNQFLTYVPGIQFGWVTQINSNNQLLIDGIISSPILLDIIDDQPVESLVDLGVAAQSANGLGQLRDITGKGTRGVMFETGNTTHTYNINIATLSTALSTTAFNSRYGVSVCADGSRIFALGGHTGGSAFSSGVVVYSPIFDVSAVTPSDMPMQGAFGRAAQSAADDGSKAITLSGFPSEGFPWAPSSAGPDIISYNMVSLTGAFADYSNLDQYADFFLVYEDGNEVVVQHPTNPMATDGSRLYIQEKDNTTIRLRHITHMYTYTLTSTQNHLSGNRARCGATCDGSTVMFAGGGYNTINTSANTIDYFSINLGGSSTTIGNLAQTGENLDGMVITDMSRAVGYYNNGLRTTNPGTYLQYTNLSSKSDALTFGETFGTKGFFRGSSVL